MDINKTLKTLVENLTEEILLNLANDINQMVKQNVSAKLAQISIHDEVKSRVKEYLSDKIGDISFPESSIPGTAIDRQTLKLTGANIKGGIIEQFGSTGIDDRATDCRVTILDEHTVVENNLLTQSLTVKTSAIVEGDLIVKGEIPTDSPAFKKLVEYTDKMKKDYKFIALKLKELADENRTIVLYESTYRIEKLLNDRPRVPMILP